MSESWMARGLCHNSPLSSKQIANIMFPTGVSGLKIAQRVCAACEVKSECFEYAVCNGIKYGVWGGLGQRQIAREIKLRKISTPAPVNNTGELCERSGLSVRQVYYYTQLKYILPVTLPGSLVRWPEQEIRIACVLAHLDLTAPSPTKKKMTVILCKALRTAHDALDWLVVSPLEAQQANDDTLLCVVRALGPSALVVRMSDVNRKVVSEEAVFVGVG